MTQFKKICEIQGYKENDICSVIKNTGKSRVYGSR